jgi:hypothetical protein
MVDRFSRIFLGLSVAVCLAATAQTCPASIKVTNPGNPNPFAPYVILESPPGFVIAGKGVRHAFGGFYASGIPILGPELPPPPPRTLTFELLAGPEGLELSSTGDLLWIPPSAEEDTMVSYTFKVRVHEEGTLIFEAETTRGFTVLTLPLVLHQPAPVTWYEREAIGWSGSVFNGYEPSDADRRKFRWSIIDPPPGLYIDDVGGIRWPTDLGYARDEPYEFKVRVAYETASGWLSDEVTHSRLVLPAPATSDYWELRNSNVAPTANGTLGFSLTSSGDWLATGEPFLGTSFSGRVRLWRRNADTDHWAEMPVLQPTLTFGGDAYGAAIAMSPAIEEQPLRLVVGAPGTSTANAGGQRTTAEGALHIFQWNESTGWALETAISCPVPGQDRMFGDAVAIDATVCVGGMPGADAAGYQTGAAGVYRKTPSGWAWSQTLVAEAPDFGDMFGESVAIGGGWLAVGASGDDGAGLLSGDSGAVHVFEDNGNSLTLVQVLRAPPPQAGARFGERLCLWDGWLFVSAFRENDNTGAVHVFEEVNGTWLHRQTLTSPFASPGSYLGVALDAADGVLAVSAPGCYFGVDPPDDGNTPWSGITLFHLENGTWKWARQVSESPAWTPNYLGWGFAIEQIRRDVTVASIPDHAPGINGVSIPYAGRLFLHRWPERLTSGFESLLAGLPMIDGRPATESDDSNGNGIPNVLEWMMGKHPGNPPDSWTAMVPGSIRPFVRHDTGSGTTEFMIPQLKGGLDRRIVIEASGDLTHWKPLEQLEWGSLEMVDIPMENSNALTYFHPVRIPPPNSGEPPARFYRWGTPPIRE